MAVRDFRHFSPAVPASAYIDDAALVIGNVRLGERVSVWPGCVIRGDVNRIEIGDDTNIQDLSVLHVNSEQEGSSGSQLLLGRAITVGHRVILHGCRIEDLCLIGMGAIIMDDAHLESQVLLAAGSLVPAGKTLEGGHLWRGTPARKVRELTGAEREYFRHSADHYARLAEQHRRAP